MNDNNKQSNYRDISQTYGRACYELTFMKKKYGVSYDEVLETIAIVGKSRAKVEDRLRQISGRQQ